MASAAAESLVAGVRGSRRASAGLWSDAWWRIRHDRVTIAAFVVLAVLVVLALAADVLADHVFHMKFEDQELLKAYAKPTLDPLAYMLGADEIGRSQVVRLLYGGRVSLAVAFLASLINMTVGIAIGLSAGYYRGVWDDIVTWSVTTLNSIPTLYLLLIFAGLFTPGPPVLIAVLGFLIWTGIANFVRGQTFALREREFVTAARTVGASQARIMIRHILPNILPLIFVLAAIDAGGIILIESALSYLGLGITPPTPSWGNMLTNAASYFVRAWWLVVSPGVMIFLTVLSLYLIGDGLRDALDPRLRGSR
ncbi:MAG: ABC transporter permease [Chloroflexota bacterium]|nr:ABC transporter permease [Chloroflexota bacterium]MDE3192332.1 ABC transporter permease [Chloroflexota bacterium]